ncbi:MAG: hypothetical protein H6553_01680 [Chitinophagales bacterium]|nr:hypothetical protein [Chitinophagales bacterium]
MVYNKENKDLEEAILIKSAKSASSKAIRTSKALGLTIKIVKDNKIIEVLPDNSTKVIQSLPKPTVAVSGLKKGMKLTIKDGDSKN